MFDGFLPASKVKKKQKLRNPSQSETEFGACQPAVAEASYEPASEVSFNTLPRKTCKSVGKICFMSNLHNIKEKRVLHVSPFYLVVVFFFF